MIELPGNKYVVTGGTGFIGSHIVEALLEQGKEVICIDNDLSPKKNIMPGARTERIDVSYNPMVKLFKGSDVIFHNAASKCTVCRDNPFKDLTVNAWGAFKVFRAAEKVGAKVVHASTGSVYGECYKQVETNQFAPVSYYGVSKLAGEQYLRSFPRLRWTTLRYFHVFGPRQDNSDNGGVIPIFITRMLKGKPIIVYGDGEQIRSFTYVKDVVRANLLAATNENMNGEAYNVASGIKVSLNTLIEILSSIINVTPQVEYKLERPGDIKYFDVDNVKISRIMPEKWTDFKTALRETVEYYAR